MTYVWALLAVLVIAYLLMRTLRGGSSATAEPTPKKPPLKRENWILGTAGSAAEKAFFVGQRTVTIGRDPGNFIQIHAEKASRHHCRIAMIDGVITLEDMSSRNGTQVNGEKVDRHPLIDGDTIAIGEDCFQFYVEGDFEVDSGLARKDLALEQYQMTAQADGDLSLKIQAAIKSAGGNIEVAAQNLGLEPAVLKKILDAQEGPKKW